jgi:hypothetical protein
LAGDLAGDLAARHRIYGLDLLGLPPSPWLGPARDSDYPEVTVAREDRAASERETAPHRIDEHGARIPLGEGRAVLLDPKARTATYVGRGIEAAELAHPYLGRVGVVFGRWAGREAFHAGAFLHDGRAWMLVGCAGAGKSTMLSLLLSRGATILADDIAVTDGEAVFAGPSCLDLRMPSQDGSLRTQRVRGNTRWRIGFEHPPSRVPVGGWVFLEWGDRTAVDGIPDGLLQRLASRRLRTELRSDPRVLLSLAALPAWRLTRERAWDRAGASADALLEALQPVARRGMAVGGRA